MSQQTRSKITTLFSAGVLLFSAAVSAQDLGTCMSDSLNGKERKDLAKWIFFIMASHPEIKPYAKMTSEQKDDADKFVSEVFTRLLTEDCLEEFKQAAEMGPQAVQQSFSAVGEIAMMELMSNQEVTDAGAKWAEYLDEGMLNKILE